VPSSDHAVPAVVCRVSGCYYQAVWLLLSVNCDVTTANGHCILASAYLLSLYLISIFPFFTVSIIS
jgi:hypothetical protein